MRPRKLFLTARFCQKLNLWCWASYLIFQQFVSLWLWCFPCLRVDKSIQPYVCELLGWCHIPGQLLSLLGEGKKGTSSSFSSQGSWIHHHIRESQNVDVPMMGMSPALLPPGEKRKIRGKKVILFCCGDSKEWSCTLRDLSRRLHSKLLTEIGIHLVNKRIWRVMASWACPGRVSRSGRRVMSSSNDWNHPICELEWALWRGQGSWSAVVKTLTLWPHPYLPGSSQVIVCVEVTFHFLGTSSLVVVPSLECLWSSQVLPAWKTSEVGLVSLHFVEGVTKWL